MTYLFALIGIIRKITCEKDLSKYGEQFHNFQAGQSLQFQLDDYLVDADENGGGP
jgi:hypothetical protein